jgi:hypothetical protein
VASVTYNGHYTVTYMDYIDTATGKTLVCQPGQTYNVTPASGHPASAGTTMPGDGRFSRNDLAEDEAPDIRDGKEKTPRRRVNSETKE